MAMVVGIIALAEFLLLNLMFGVESSLSDRFVRSQAAGLVPDQDIIIVDIDEYSLFGIARKEGYDPFALVAVLQTLDSINPEDSSLALLYKTHPPASDRLDRLDPALEQFEDPIEESPLLEKRFNTYVARRP